MIDHLEYVREYFNDRIGEQDDEMDDWFEEQRTKLAEIQEYLK